MRLATIKVDPNKARQEFLTYRRSVRERHGKELDTVQTRQLREDEQIMRGYRALSQGKQVIDIMATIRKGGSMIVEGQKNWSRGRMFQLPRLAIMRADQQWCHVSTDRDGSVVFYNQPWSPDSREKRNVVTLSQVLPTFTDSVAESWYSTFRAMVPPVPPGLRPAAKLGNYHILWEATWEEMAPKDPALLKHIGGDLYVVLAVWDLTELERTVLGGRFR